LFNINIVLSVFMLSVVVLGVKLIMLNVVLLGAVILSLINSDSVYAEFCYAECHYAECRGAQNWPDTIENRVKQPVGHLSTSYLIISAGRDRERERDGGRSSPIDNARWLRFPGLDDRSRRK